MVAGWNTQPSRIGGVDAEYLATLSEDATPVILAALPRLDTLKRATLLDSRTKGAGLEAEDWRSATLSRFLAGRSLRNSVP